MPDEQQQPIHTCGNMSTGPHATVVDIQADIKDTAAESMGQTGSGKLEPKQDILLQEKHAGQFEGGCLTCRLHY